MVDVGSDSVIVSSCSEVASANDPPVHSHINFFSFS